MASDRSKAAYDKREKELRASGKSASQAGRQTFREFADKQKVAERAYLDGKRR